MEVLVLFGLLAGIALVGFSIFAINKYSLEKHQYKPFNIVNMGALAVPLFFLVWAVVFSMCQKPDDPPVDWKDLNHTLLLVFFIIVFLLVAINIFVNTHNIFLALYAPLVMSVGVAFVVAILIFWILNSMSKWYREKD